MFNITGKFNRSSYIEGEDEPNMRKNNPESRHIQGKNMYCILNNFQGRSFVLKVQYIQHSFSLKFSKFLFRRVSIRHHYWLPNSLTRDI